MDNDNKQYLWELCKREVIPLSVAGATIILSKLLTENVAELPQWVGATVMSVLQRLEEAGIITVKGKKSKQPIPELSVN